MYVDMYVSMQVVHTYVSMQVVHTVQVTYVGMYVCMQVVHTVQVTRHVCMYAGSTGDVRIYPQCVG